MEGFKLSIILDHMVSKLRILEKLKDSMGDEMAEMMSEEITKVMNEQRDLEQRYAELVTLRSTLTGISNKPKLKETVIKIGEVQRELKESTRKLCRQLQDNPNVEGNNNEITKHKNSLIDWMRDLKHELLSAEITYKKYAQKINDELNEQKAFDTLREEEKRLNGEIKHTVDEFKQCQEDFAKEQQEALTEIQDRKTKLAETEVDAKLCNQYLEEYQKGAQACRDRGHQKDETKLES